MNYRLKLGNTNLLNSKIFLSILLLIIYLPPYFARNHSLNILSSILNLVVLLFLVFIILWLKLVKVPDFRKGFIWICLYYGYLMIITIINKNDNIVSFVRTNIPSLCMCFIFLIWMTKNPVLLINAFQVYDYYIIFNLLTIIAFPNGLYATDAYTANWLLGYKNQQIRMILPILSMNIIRSYINVGRLNLFSLVLIVSVVMTFFLTDSATSLVGFLLFFLMFLFFHKKYKKLPGIFSLITAIIIVVFLFILIVINHNQAIFSYLIETLLGRNLTFTSRTRIWELALIYCTANPIFGYGFLTSEDYVNMFLGIKYYAHPHNYILYNYMMGGIFLTIILLMGFIFANNALNRNRSNIYSKVVLYCLMSFLLMGLTESITGTILLYPMLIMAIEMDSLSKIPCAEKKRSIIRIRKRRF